MMKEDNPNNALGDRIFAYGFVVVLFVPIVWMSIHGTDELGVKAERRRAHPKPAMPTTTAELKVYPSEYEAWFDDSYGLRGHLLHAHHRFKFDVMGIAPSDKFVMGPNGWLFGKEGQTFDGHRGLNSFPPATLFYWAREYERTRKALNDRGIPYLFTFVPDKITIYPEEAPQAFFQTKEPPRFRNFMSWMRKHLPHPPLYLDEVLLKAKEPSQQIYYSVGSHWTSRGAWAGYSEMARHLERALPELRMQKDPPNSPPGEFTKVDPFENPFLKGDKKADTVTHFGPLPPAQVDVDLSPSRSVTMRVRRPDLAHLPRALVIHDSFSLWLFRILDGHFSEILYVWQAGFDYRLVDRINPDVVIHQMVERFVVATPETIILTHGDPVEGDPLGIFHHPQWGSLRVATREEGPAVRLAEKEAILKREGDGVFTASGPPWSVRLKAIYDDEGAVTQVRLIADDIDAIFVAAPDMREPSTAVKNFTGIYEADGESWSVLASKGGLQLFDQEGRRVGAFVGKDKKQELRVGPLRYSLTLAPQGAGAVLTIEESGVSRRAKRSKRDPFTALRSQLKAR